MSLELIAASSQKRTTVNHELNATERTSLETNCCKLTKQNDCEP